MNEELMHDPTQLPPDLPRPADDGAASHLLGLTMPAVALPSTGEGEQRVDVVPSGFERLVMYAFPMTGLPGVEPPEGWDSIPGARGCTPESSGFRDHAIELESAGAAIVGLSTQSTRYQKEAVERLRLPYPLLSDHDLVLTEALRLPTFRTELRPEQNGGGVQSLLKRLTLVIRDGRIEKVFYPVFPPDTHAEEVLRWIQKQPIDA